MIIGCGANFKAGKSARTEAVEIETSHSPSRNYGLNEQEFCQKWDQIKRLHGDTPGTLAYMHIQQPLRWPYAEYLLGATSEGENTQNNDYLSIEQTKDIVSEMLKYGRSCDWALCLNVSRTMLSYWKSGYRQMHCDLAEKIRGMMSASIR